MNKVKIILDGVEKEVDVIFYIYNSKYYLIYTEKEIDENGYVVLHLVKVAKEIQNTPDGPLDTGYMVGVEVSDEAEWREVQTSISEIVEDKKNNTKNPKIQYLPITMLSTLKIMSKKTFRLMKEIMVDNFKLELDINPSTPVVVQLNEIEPIQQQAQVQEVQPIEGPIPVSVPLASINEKPVEQQENIIPTIVMPTEANTQTQQGDAIIDYRTSFFEEQDKNKHLKEQIDELTKKINNIKEIIG